MAAENKIFNNATIQIGNSASEEHKLKIFHSDNTYVEIYGYGIYMSRTNSYIRPTSDGGQILAIGTDNNTWNYVALDTNYFTVSTNATEHFRITNTGNVGIGTTSPIQTFDLNGVAYFRGGTAADFGVGDTPSDTAIIIDEGDYIYTRDNNNLRKLIGKSGSDIIYIGQTGTSLIDGISLQSGQSGYVSIVNGDNGEYARFTGGSLGIGTTSPSQKLEVNGNVKADNFIGGNDAGIYSFNDTVTASTSEDIFSISCTNGAQAFRVTFVCNTSGYSVAKTYEVVHAFGADPVFFKVVDTGAYDGHDFDASFATEAGGLEANNKKIICTITNNSATIDADIVTTVFLGGSPTAITVTAL